MKEVEQKIGNFLQKMYYLTLEKSNQTQVKNEFYKYFINQDTKERSID